MMAHYLICVFLQRDNYRLKSVVKYAAHKEFTDVIILAEHLKRPCGMYICHLPEGPTSFFKLTNVKLAQEMKGSAALTTHDPEVILNNFTTRLGRRAARQLAALFPQVCSLSSQRAFNSHFRVPSFMVDVLFASTTNGTSFSSDITGTYSATQVESVASKKSGPVLH